MKRILALICGCCLLSSCGSQGDATAIWTQVLSKCGSTQFIGKQYVFFGVSNSIGPGSGWRIADDNSLRLLFLINQPFPATTDSSTFVVKNPVAECKGDSTTDWNVRLAVPFSVSSASLSADIGSVLSRATRVQVSIGGFATDLLTETPWLAAFQALPPNSVYRANLSQPKAILAENAVKVTGLKAVFDFQTDLSADVQAKLSGKTFTIGEASTPSSSSSGNPSSASAASGSTNSTSSVGAVSGSADTCSAPETNSQPDSVSGTQSANNGASLHAEVKNARQIVLCVPGPVYLLAAYGKYVDGVLSVAPGASAVIEPVEPKDLPKGVALEPNSP